MRDSAADRGFVPDFTARESARPAISQEKAGTGQIETGTTIKRQAPKNMGLIRYISVDSSVLPITAILGALGSAGKSRRVEHRTEVQTQETPGATQHRGSWIISKSHISPLVFHYTVLVQRLCAYTAYTVGLFICRTSVY